MPSLLDYMVAQRNPRLAGLLGVSTPGADLLVERERQRSLLEGVQPSSPTGVPGGLLGPPPAPADLRQLAGSAQLRAAPSMPGGPSTPPGAGDGKSLQRQRAALAATIAQVNGGRVTDRQIEYIRDVSAETEKTGGGRPGVSFLGRLFGLEDIPDLTAEQRNSLRRQALLISGLHLLSTVGVNEISAGQALAGGVLMARQAVTQTAGEMLDEQRRQQSIRDRYAALQNPDMTELERWQEIRRRAIADGDLEAVKVVNDVIKELRELSAGESEDKMVQVNGSTFRLDSEGNLRDPFSREIVQEAPKAEGELVTVQTPGGPRTFRQDADGTLRDPFTGEIVRQAPQEAAGGLDSGEVLDRTDKLADNFRQETGALQESVSLARAAQSAGNTSAGDNTLIFVYNKLIDPGSRVTEGEVQAGRNLGGLSAQARGFFERKVEGRLPPDARREIEAEIANLRRNRTAELRSIASQYEERARAAGVPPHFVVRRGLIPELSPESGGTSEYDPDEIRAGIEALRSGGGR